MRIAVQGCSHGELDKIYESIVQCQNDTGKRVDLLICCGDFQACRNENDLKAMKVPKKHARIANFWKYYCGQSVAPCLTIVIGGNHEASNHMWELYYGGWLAPRIYYLGSAGVVNVGGLRIGGISGIYKKFDYHKGHHETPPLSPPEIISIFHVRSLEVMRCKSLQKPVDIFLSHDWPLGIYEFGNKQQLLRTKPFFEEDVVNNELGSPPAAEILETVQPAYWFSGHLHVKFTAMVPHDDFGKCTRFLALDKCLPRRKFLQVLEIGKELCTPPILEYDPEWLAILSETANFYNPINLDQRLPASVMVSEEQIREVSERFGSMIIPENFKITVPVYREHATDDMLYPTINPQSQIFCDKLGVKNEAVPDGAKPLSQEELNLTHDSDANMSINISRRSDVSGRLDLSNLADRSTSSDLQFITEKPDEAPDYKDFTPPKLNSSSSKWKDPVTPGFGSRLASTPNAKSSTPVVLKRRLTLPAPKRAPLNLSPIKLGTPDIPAPRIPDAGDAEKKTMQDKTASPSVTPVPSSSVKKNLLPSLDSNSSADLLPPGFNEVELPQPKSKVTESLPKIDGISGPKNEPLPPGLTPVSLPVPQPDPRQANKDIQSVKSIVEKLTLPTEKLPSSGDSTKQENPNDEFDLGESDDALLSKFLSLKKKFGRDENKPLSDSLVVNTSLLEEEKGEREKGSKKKFKMEIHNDLDN